MLLQYPGASVSPAAFPPRTRRANDKGDGAASAIEKFHFHLLQAAEKVTVSPNPDGLPGVGAFQKLLNGAAALGLMACVAAFIIGAAQSATALVQMGQRPYMPDTGAFLAEDPVLGRIGTGMTVDRYLYALNNPINRYDLNGRDVCLFGGCIDPDDVMSIAEDLEGGAATTEEGASAVGSATGNAADDGWDWTAPGRGWVADRSQDFWKAHGDTLEDIYHFAGEYWQGCSKGAPPGILVGGTIGSFGGPAGTAIGGGLGGVAGCGAVVGTEVAFGEFLP